jgi:GTP cyclohydrolase I
LARQVQERLTKQIAEALDGALQPHGVGVVRSPPLQQGER